MNIVRKATEKRDSEDTDQSFRDEAKQGWLLDLSNVGVVEQPCNESDDENEIDRQEQRKWADGELDEPLGDLEDAVFDEQWKRKDDATDEPLGNVSGCVFFDSAVFRKMLEHPSRASNLLPLFRTRHGRFEFV